jgi:hypothetical protein
VIGVDVTLNQVHVPPVMIAPVMVAPVMIAPVHVPEGIVSIMRTRTNTYSSEVQEMFS